MSLDFYLECQCCKQVLFDKNITHNLGNMADAAGIYEALWRPRETGFELAESLIPVLSEGLEKLKSDPGEYRKYDAPNGWGLYEHFVPFVEGCLNACIKYPKAKVQACV